MKIKWFEKRYIYTTQYTSDEVIKKCLSREKKGKLLHKVVRHLVRNQDRWSGGAWNDKVYKVCQLAASVPKDHIKKKYRKEIRKAVRKLSSSSTVKHTKAEKALFSPQEKALKNALPLRGVDCAIYGRGIHNGGNTCYMNATLKMLWALPAFRSFLTQSKSPLAQHLRNIFQELADGKKEALHIKKEPLASFIQEMRKAGFPHLANGTPQDAEELMRALLNALNIHATIWKIETVGHGIEKKSQEERHTIFPMYVPSNSPYRISFQSLIDNRRDQLQIGEFSVETTSQLSCGEKLPPYVIFHMNRYADTGSSSRERRLREIDVDIPHVLQLRGKEQERAPYRLRSAIIYSGNIRGGHYYTYIRHNNSTWVRHDDEAVEVQKDAIAEAIISKKAMLLGYEKIQAP